MHGTQIADAGLWKETWVAWPLSEWTDLSPDTGLLNPTSKCFRRPASFRLVSFPSVYVTGLSVHRSATEIAVERLAFKLYLGKEHLKSSETR